MEVVEEEVVVAETETEIADTAVVVVLHAVPVAGENLPY